MKTLAPQVFDYELERGKPMPSLKHAFIQRNLLLPNAGLGPDYLVLPELGLALDAQKALPDVSVWCFPAPPLI